MNRGLAAALALCLLAPSAAAEPDGFRWPKGRRAAVSLSFDDGRPSQLDHGLAILGAGGVRATFYLVAADREDNVRRRLSDWKRVAAAGHEIGNHSSLHPCAESRPWVLALGADHALENYTLERMRHELRETNDSLEKRLGVRPRTFAYPCGETVVGRGATAESYAPLVGRLFDAGRGFDDGAANRPADCDLSRVSAIRLDALSFSEMRAWADRAAAEGAWLVFAGHEIRPSCGSDPLCTAAPDLEAFTRYLRDPRNGFWVETVGTVARYVRASRQRAAPAKQKKPL